MKCKGPSTYSQHPHLMPAGCLGWGDKELGWMLIWDIFSKNQENMKIKNVKRKKQVRRWFSRKCKTKLQLILSLFTVLKPK